MFCRLVKVDVASHSPQMDPLRGELLAALQGITPRASAVPIYSTVLAQPIAGSDLDPAYWVAEPAPARAVLARRSSVCCRTATSRSSR